MDAFIGIDQSFTGFAVTILVPELDLVLSDLKAYTAAKFGQGVDRLTAISEHLVNMAHDVHWRAWDVQHICMEGYSRGSKFRREDMGELAAIVKLTLRTSYDRPVCYPTIIAPRTLKCFVADKGNASKAEMIQAVNEKWGQNITNDNIADSYGLARAAQSLHTGVYQYPYEKDALAGVEQHTEIWPKAA